MDTKLKAYLISVLRRASYKTKARGDALRAARRERGVYACASCQGPFKRGDIQVDHVVPCIDPSGQSNDLESVAARMFCDGTGLQILCKPCHYIKSKGENSLRKRVDKRK